MANVHIIQRDAHLAGPVKFARVNGRDGKVSRALLVAISNTRHTSEDGLREDSTSIQWTLWGRQAECAFAYLTRGSHVNIVGRVHNHQYAGEQGRQVFALTFTAEEIDYLDNRAQGEARRAKVEGLDGGGADGAHGGLPGAVKGFAPTKSPHGRGRRSLGSAA